MIWYPIPYSNLILYTRCSPSYYKRSMMHTLRLLRRWKFGLIWGNWWKFLVDFPRCKLECNYQWKRDEFCSGTPCISQYPVDLLTIIIFFYYTDPLLWLECIIHSENPLQLSLPYFCGLNWWGFSGSKIHWPSSGAQLFFCYYRHLG